MTLLDRVSFRPLRFRHFVSKIPLHLYPESPQKLHPNVQPHRPAVLPRHGLTAEYFSSLKPRETAHPIPPPPQSGNSICVGGTLPFRGGAACRRGSDSVPLRGTRGLAPGESLPTFFSEESRPGRGAERPLKGSAEGQRPSHIAGRRGPVPAKFPLGKPPTKCKPKPTFNRKNKTGGKPYGLQTGRSNDD